MYSPKISEELVPMLYRIAKARNIAMTKLVNDILLEKIKDVEERTIAGGVASERINFESGKLNH